MKKCLILKITSIIFFIFLFIIINNYQAYATNPSTKSIYKTKKIPKKNDSLVAICTSKCVYINTNGNIILKTNYKHAYNFSEGLAAVQVGSRYGYINSSGKLVIEPKFTEAKPFSEGLAVVQKDYRYGYIDKTGKLVIEPKFYKAESFSNGLAYIVTSEYSPAQRMFIDKTGKSILSLIGKANNASSFSNGVAWLNDDSEDPSDDFRKWSIINKKPEIIKSFNDGPNFRAEPFNSGLAPLQKGDSWGFINTKGDFAIEAKYCEAGKFSEGLAPVSPYGDKFGYINAKGNMVIKPKFDHAWDFNNGVAPVEYNGQRRYINKKGIIIY